MRWPIFKGKAGKKAPHLRTGEWGEKHAARFLKKKGYRILGRRVRVGRRYELDIVARQDNVLVFVEVKTRGSEAFGRPVTAVDTRKQRLLGRAAMQYLKRLKEKPHYFRFDVVEVVGHPGEKSPVTRHIENAFQLDKSYRMG